MGISKDNLAQYFNFNQDRDWVGDRGCFWLRRACFKGLTLRISSFRVSLEKNGIRDQGCKHLCKLENGRVKKIDLYNGPETEITYFHVYTYFSESRDRNMKNQT